MADQPPTYIGLEIGGTKLQVVAGDRDGRIERRWRAKVDPSAGGARICRQLLEGLATIREGTVAIGLGAGFGGPVDARAGRICRSHQIDGWEDFDLGQWLARETGLPCRVENDSNLAALAEATLGAGAGCNPVFYFNLGSGVGGGLVVDGAIYHGLAPGEAEFGHLRLDRTGSTVESRCSGWAIDRRIRTAGDSRPDSALAAMIGREEGGEARHLPAALAAGDKEARLILTELAEDLAFALSHVIHLLHPRVIVLGGGLSMIGEPLRDAIAKALPRHVMGAFASTIDLRLPALGEDAVPVGALRLASHTPR